MCSMVVSHCVKGWTHAVNVGVDVGDGNCNSVVEQKLEQ